MEPSPPPRPKETWALYAGTVVAYADMYLTQPILPDLSREFGAAPAEAALTVSAVVFSIAAASVVAGPLSDALGRRRVMVGATLLLAGATLLCAAAPSLGALVALRAAQGVFVPGMTAVSVAYAGDRFPASALRAVVGGVIGASVVGGLVGRVGAGWVTEHLGWRAAFAVAAAMTVGAAVWMARALVPLRPAVPARWRDAVGGMLGHLRDRRLVGAFLVGGSLFFGWIGLFTYLPYHLSAPPYGLSTGLVSSVYLVYAAGVVASPLAGRASQRIAPTRLVGYGLAVEAGGMLLALAAPLPAVVVGLVVLVLGTFTAQAVVPAFVNQAARTAKGGASALYLFFYYLGGTLGSLLPGLAWQTFGWTGVVAACAAAVAIGIAANALLCADPAEPRPRPHPPAVISGRPAVRAGTPSPPSTPGTPRTPPPA